ncbi:jacalin-like lectin [Pseudoduganella violacea]|uniref:Jacalin-type lectin domain-containing protein n=1 Tax=Pseudoduganella violacea TaxID=1715466 RepID=A0A7W5BEA4_9BURK|nr:hypothetical protein [Pseudoduganella violacea]MBB3121554.1 hypothetical protein [Pseudoduganella violacea]
MANHSAPSSAFNIGQGYSCTLGPLQTAVHTQVLDTAGGNSEIAVSLCSEEDTLKQSLEINIGRKIAVEGIGGYSEKFSLFQKLRFSEHSLCIVVKASVVSKSHYCQAAQLHDDIAAPATAAELDQFCKLYGDAYVSELVRGAQYFAVYAYRCKSREEKLELKARIEASGIIENVTVSGKAGSNFSHAVTQISQNVELHQTVIGSSFTMSGEQDVIRTAYAFFEAANNLPTGTVGFKTTGYEHVFSHPGIEAALAALAHNRQLFNGSGAQEGLLAREARLIGIKERLANLEHTMRRYGCTLDSATQERQRQIQADLDACNELRNRFNQSPTTPLENPYLPAAAYGWPSIQYETRQSKRLGGGGGQPYHDVTTTDFLDRGMRVSHIRLRGGAYVDLIEITYKDASGQTCKFTHGQEQGNQVENIALGDADYITEIAVPSSEGNIYIDYIRIKTNNFPQGVGVGGNDRNLEPIFSYDDRNQHIFVGLVGRCERWNDAVSALFLQIKGVSWM